MRWLVAILVVAVLGLAVAQAGGTAPDARSVRVFVQVRPGAPDPSGLLPDAWMKATQGRGRLVLVSDRSRANAVIEVLPNDCINDSWSVNRSQRAVLICAGSASVLRYGVVVIVHEIGHLWCCDIGGWPDGHWVDDAESGLMNGSGYGLERGVFSSRDLGALGLY